MKFAEERAQVLQVKYPYLFKTIPSLRKVTIVVDGKDFAVRRRHSEPMASDKKTGKEGIYSWKIGSAGMYLPCCIYIRMLYLSFNSDHCSYDNYHHYPNYTITPLIKSYIH